MKGLRIKVKPGRWDRRVPVVPVVVLGIVFGSILLGTTSRLSDERAIRLEAERILETEVAELQRRIEVLRDDMFEAKVKLALERRRMTESFFTVDTGSNDDKIVIDDDGGDE